MVLFKLKIIEEFVKDLKTSIAIEVKKAKIFINDIQDIGDYAYACGVVSALRFIIDNETFIELNQLLENKSNFI